MEIIDTENVKNEAFEIQEAFPESEESAIPSPIVLPIKIFPQETKPEAEVQSSIEIQLSQPQSLPTKKGDDKNIPDFEEFMEYAKTLESYEVGLDSEIQSKYENWKNNGWRNGSDRLITNWKSSLKSALPFMKNTQNKDTLSIQSIPNIKRPKSQNGN